MSVYKSKILLAVGLVLALALSACTSQAGLLGTATGLPAQRSNSLLANTQQPFPASAEGETPALGVFPTSQPASAATSMVATEVAGESKPVPVTGEGAVNGLTTFPTRLPEVQSKLLYNDAGKTPAPTHNEALVPGTGGNPIGAVISPNGERSQAIQLSNVMGANIFDKSGKPIGTVADYIVNLCTSSISYAVVSPDPNLGLKGGSTLVIPYEVFTQGHGVIDVHQNSLVMPFSITQLQGSPVVNQKPDLSNLNWESSVRKFWSKYAKLGAASSECQSTQQSAAQATPTGTAQSSSQGSSTGTPTGTAQSNSQGSASGTPSGTAQSTSQSGSGSGSNAQIVYASDLLSMTLQDQNGNPLGQVVQVYQTPETGQVNFLAIDILAPQQTATAAASATGAATAQATATGTAQPTGQATGTGTAQAGSSTAQATGQATSAPTSASTPAGPAQVAPTSQQVPVKIVVIPISAVTLQQSQGSTVLVLSVPVQAFKGAPTSNQLPDVGQANWDAPISQYWSKFTAAPQTSTATPTPMPTPTSAPPTSAAVANTPLAGNATSTPSATP